MYGNTIQRINLYEAFPISIREIPLSWNDTGNLMRLAVSISFSEFTIVGSALEGNVNQPVISRNNAQAAIDRSLII